MSIRITNGPKRNGEVIELYLADGSRVIVPDVDVGAPKAADELVPTRGFGHSVAVRRSGKWAGFATSDHAAVREVLAAARKQNAGWRSRQTASTRASIARARAAEGPMADTHVVEFKEAFVDTGARGYIISLRLTDGSVEDVVYVNHSMSDKSVDEAYAWAKQRVAAINSSNGGQLSAVVKPRVIRPGLFIPGKYASPNRKVDVPVWDFSTPKPVKNPRTPPDEYGDRTGYHMSLNYGQLPPKAEFLRIYEDEMGSKSYPMTLRGEDADVMASIKEREAGNWDADDLWDVLKKLTKKLERGNDDAGSLASSILETLGIEWI